MCLLHLLATLPVRISSSERSFSNLLRVKSWLQASMGEERLVEFTHLNINKHIDVEAIIDKFSKIGICNIMQKRNLSNNY